MGNKEILWEKLLKEVRLGRVASPFDEVPFENFIQSPIGLVSKDDGTKTRLIFYFSHDFDDYASVNHFTPDKLCSVKYNDLDTAMKLCLKLAKQGAETVYLAKTDAQSAFRILPLNRSSWSWLVMKAENPQTGKWQYFIDKCLPFSASISC